MDASQVQQRLKSLRTYEHLQNFFGDLGYSDAGSDPVSMRQWPERIRETAFDPRYVAERGQFKIIYCELAGDRIRRAVQRPIVEQLSKDHPYSLIVFRTQPDDLAQVIWEFVNIRIVASTNGSTQPNYSGHSYSRQVRRLQIGPSERIQNRLRTASERLARVNLNGQPSITALAIQELHDQAFDVEQVTRDFYGRYVQVFDALATDIQTRNALIQADAEAQARLLLDRLMFLYFIQKKGWLNGQDDYLYGRFERGHHLATDATTYYHDVIAPLFRALAESGRTDSTLYGVGEIPFLNGGLFQLDTITLTLNVGNGLFRTAFDQLFERYAFTIEEDTPDEKAVAIDPEMLGKVFENLVLTRDQEKDLRKSTGSYYTPRTIVRFMCQQSLKAYLVEAWRAAYQPQSPDGALPLKMAGKGGQVEMRDLELIAQQHAYTERLLSFIEGGIALITLEEARALRSWLRNVRIIDPAVGSGAFLVGMLQELLRLIRLLDERIGESNTHARNYDYDLKRHLIEDCLYGVDIQEQAVQICELRLWMSLVVDFEPDTVGRPIREWLRDVRPLPNLSYRVRCGNSLVEKVLGETIRLDMPGLSNRIGETLNNIRDAKLLYFSMTVADEKHRTQAAILALKARLTHDFLSYREKLVDEKLSRQANLPGLITPTRAERAERDRQTVERDRLLALVTRADTIRRSAEALRAPDRDQDQLVALEKDLGSFIWRVDFGEVFAERGGFDIAIGNPPYIRQERIKDQKPDFEKLYADVYTGTADLYVYFYAQALNLLHKGGVLSYISPNKFMRAGYGEKLRSHLSAHTTLDTLMDFGDLPVFEATTYPLISVMVKADPLPDDTVRAVNVTHIAQLESLPNVIRAAPPMPQSSLRSAGWQLAAPDVLALMEKLRSAGTPLGTYVGGKLFYGIKTGLNEAFVIDQATRDRLIAADPNSADVIKPWLRGQDVKRWRTESADLYLIGLQNSGDRSASNAWAKANSEVEARSIFQATYPALHDHLTQFEEALRKRQDQGQYWWELRACAYYSEFAKPKISYPHFNAEPNFTFDSDGYFSVNKTYIIPSNDLSLLGILNSPCVNMYLRSITSVMRGGYMEFTTQVVEQIPIPTVTAEVRAEIESRVRDLLVLCGQGTQVAALEAELNERVYRAYGLSAAEVALIEGAVAVRVK